MERFAYSGLVVHILEHQGHGKMCVDGGYGYWLQ